MIKYSCPLRGASASSRTLISRYLYSSVLTVELGRSINAYGSPASVSGLNRVKATPSSSINAVVSALQPPMLAIPLSVSNRRADAICGAHSLISSTAGAVGFPYSPAAGAEAYSAVRRSAQDLSSRPFRYTNWDSCAPEAGRERLPASWTASTYSPAGRGSLSGNEITTHPFAFTVTETSASGSCSCEMSASLRKRNRLTETVPFPDTSRASVPAGAVVTNCAATVSSALSFTDAVATEPANSETDACGATAEKAAVMTSAPFAGKASGNASAGRRRAVADKMESNFFMILLLSNYHLDRQAVLSYQLSENVWESKKL